jgi:hypothetical protein
MPSSLFLIGWLQPPVSRQAVLTRSGRGAPAQQVDEVAEPPERISQAHHVLSPPVWVE